MYNRLHKFIEDNNLIYNLQFGFRQNVQLHFTFNIQTIHLTEKIG